MSTKTPTLQTRSQYGRDWGNFTSLATLPNSSSNALANPYFTQLEVGDVAYITGTSQRAVCTAVGTLSGANATWTAIGSGGTTGPLFAFNRINTSQFDTTPDTIGTPVTPTLSAGAGALTMSMAVGSGAGSQAIWYVNTSTVPWANVRKVRFVFTPTVGVTNTDAYTMGVVVAADRSLGTALTYGVSTTAFTAGLGNGASPGALITNIPITLSTITTIEVDLFTNLLDNTVGPPTYTPNGVPSYVGAVQITALTPTAVVKNSIFANKAIGYAGVDWGPAVPEQIGVFLQCPSGVVSATGVSVNMAVFTIYGD
jgi:hypothetical protein